MAISSVSSIAGAAFFRAHTFCRDHALDERWTSNETNYRLHTISLLVSS